MKATFIEVISIGIDDTILAMSTYPKNSIKKGLREQIKKGKIEHVRKLLSDAERLELFEFCALIHNEIKRFENGK